MVDHGSGRKTAPWRNHEVWHETAFADTPYFGPRHAATFHHEQVRTIEDVVDRFRSASHVAVLGGADLCVVLDEVRPLLGSHPDTAGRDRIAIPYRVDACWCEKTIVA